MKKVAMKTSDAVGAKAGDAPARLIDAKIDALGGWRGETLARVRKLIREAAPGVAEAVKWRKPTNPAGVPVWEKDGILCTGETYKDKVKLTFAKGAALDDPAGLFNASLDGGVRRAIDIREGDKLDAKAFKALIRSAAAANKKNSKTLKSSPPGKMKAYESFADWEKGETRTNKLTRVVSKHVQSAAPRLAKSVKWGQGCFLKGDKPAIYIHTEKDHVQLGFYAGASLKDPDKLLEGKGKHVRHIKIASPGDIETKKADYFIRQVR